MVQRHLQLDGCDSEQTPGHGEGQGSLDCCCPWGCKELDTAERLNNKPSNLWYLIVAAQADYYSSLNG